VKESCAGDVIPVEFLRLESQLGEMCGREYPLPAVGMHVHHNHLFFRERTRHHPADIDPLRVRYCIRRSATASLPQVPT